MDWFEDLVEAAEDAVNWVVETGEEIVENVVETAEAVGEAIAEIGEVLVDAVIIVGEMVIGAVIEVGTFIARATVYLIDMVSTSLEILLGGIAADILRFFTPRNPLDPSSLRPEIWRPQFHFSMAEGWINDPCGLVRSPDGFHLSTQHVPGPDSRFDIGKLVWSSAASDDLVSWRERFVPALVGGTFFNSLFTVNDSADFRPFTGSAVVDADNSSDLFRSTDRSRLAALYTRASEPFPPAMEQQQHLAISSDSGDSWQDFDETPVAATTWSKIFWYRDPKVLRLPGRPRWLMTLSQRKSVRLLISDDLVAWAPLLGAAEVIDLSRILPPNRFCECAELFPLRLQGAEKWVLVFSQSSIGRQDLTGINFSNGLGIAGFSVWYMIGDFSVEAGFVPDPEFADRALPLDFGPDLYAMQTWFDPPATDETQPQIERTAIGWMSNWAYADRLPTSPWLGQLSIPRRLELKTVDGEMRLAQTPIPSLARQATPIALGLDGLSFEGELVIGGLTGNQYDLSLTVEPESAEQFRILVGIGGGEGLTIGWSASTQELFLDRFGTLFGVSGAFRKVRTAPISRGGRAFAPAPAVNGRVQLRILVDHSSVEVFAQQGSAVMTALRFPNPSNDGVLIESIGGMLRIIQARGAQLDTIWQ